MSKILIVDDEKELVDLLDLVLKSLGYEVLVAIDGNTAVEITRFEMPQIIFLDLAFPKGDLDGVGILKQIREFDTDVKVVISSGLDAKDSRYEQVQKLGISKVLHKPASLASIRTLIRELT